MRYQPCAVTAQAVELDLSAYKGRAGGLIGAQFVSAHWRASYFLTLQAHGFFWLLLSETDAAPAWHGSVCGNGSAGAGSAGRSRDPDTERQHGGDRVYAVPFKH